MVESYDVIVIGSGFGGGTIALRQAQSGRRVCVLERGRRWRGKNVPASSLEPPATDFPEFGDKHFFWGRQFWNPARQRLGLYEFRQMVNLQGLVGAGVGGGSLIWANVVVAPPESVFAQGWPAEVTRQSLDEYYRRADTFLRPVLVPGLLQQQGEQFNTRAAALRQAAAQVGRPWQAVKVAVDFGNPESARQNGFGTARQLGCNLCGLCTAGCPQNAKNTVDISYIAQAESLGAEIRPLHQATAIKPDGSSGYRVYYKRFTLDGRLVERGCLKAARVVLSAGTFGTTELLLRCKRNGFLPGLSSALGTRFSINGNVVSGALKRGGQVDPKLKLGPAIASMVNYGNFAVEDLANPAWTAGMVGASVTRRILAFCLALAGYKPSKQSLSALEQDLLVYVGVGDDGARGRLNLNRFGLLSLDWPGGIASEPGIRALHQAMEELSLAQGRQYVPDVLSTFNRPVAYHPLGGCPMGSCEATGVVDSYGRVFGYRGLYVADGSIVPTALGRNPSYTIAALAERVAEQMSLDR